MSWYRARSNSLTYSSSELSSPPPLSPVQHASNARILSYSPVLEAERGIQHTLDIEEMDSLFHHQTTFAKPPQPIKLPSFRSLFADFTTKISGSVISSEQPTEPIDPAGLSPESDEDDVFDSDDSDDAGLDLLLNKHYHVSSERGRWKTEPLPFLFQRQRINSLPEPFPPHQPSCPTTRLNSEPAEAHSTAAQGILLQSDDSHIVHERSGLTQSPSPLPPSSPPLSPVSSFVSPGLGPVSPLSLSSPTFLPTSPIPEECPPLESDLVLEDVDRSAPMTPKEDCVSFSDPTPVISHRTQVSSIQPRENEMTIALTSSMETRKERDPEDDGAAATVLREGSAIATSATCSDLKPSSSDRDDEDRMVDEPSLNKTAEDHDAADTSPTSGNATKRKNEVGRGGPRKRRRVEVVVYRRTVTPKKVPRRRGKGWVIESESEDDSDDDASPKSMAPASLPPPPLPPLDPEDPNSEITGMLIEALATSRASSLPISSLYKSIIESRPSLKSQRTKREWCDVLLKVLVHGYRAGGRGVFGRVESSGKDETDKPLESQWFYIPENDWDQDRAMIIRSMLPRPAKRNETKKYKQYYYQPLSKISRWDAEEDE